VVEREPKNIVGNLKFFGKFWACVGSRSSCPVPTVGWAGDGYSVTPGTTTHHSASVCHCTAFDGAENPRVRVTRGQRFKLRRSTKVSTPWNARLAFRSQKLGCVTKIVVSSEIEEERR
jgi:hypothetical protein